MTNVHELGPRGPNATRPSEKAAGSTGGLSSLGDGADGQVVMVHPEILELAQTLGRASHWILELRTELNRATPAARAVICRNLEDLAAEFAPPARGGRS